MSEDQPGVRRPRRGNPMPSRPDSWRPPADEKEQEREWMEKQLGLKPTRTHDENGVPLEVGDVRRYGPVKEQQ
jgi:hypothetical protein